MRSNIIRRCYGFSSGYSSSSTNATTIRHTMGSVQPLAASVLPVVSTSSSLSTSLPSPVALQDPTQAQAYYPPTAIPLTGSSPLHISNNVIPPSQGATINTTTTALAEPVVPRVFAWYRPDAPFDMQRVHELLSARGIEPGCVYPPIISSTHVASSSSSTTAVGGGAAASSKSHPGSQHHHHQQHQRLGSSAMAAAKSVRTVSSWKQVEVLGFTIPTKPADATGKPGAITVQTTYFVFADGGLVGWNATWDELVWMRGILLAGNGSTSTTSPPVASTSAAGTSTTSDILSRSPQQQPTTTSSPTTTAAPLWSSSVGHNKLASSMTAVESMRYQLFWTLPMAERPHDSEQEPSTYIDAVKDRIVLEDDADIGMKLPYSVALLHSVKLDAMHHALEPVASLVKRWQQHLSMDGELVCTIKDLRKAKTNLLNLMEALNAQLYAQATPKLFWSGTYHNVRGHYRDACVHLEVEDRASSIKAQMESMDESLSYLHDESHASENEWLTWVIIGLIAMEVMVALGVLESLMGWLFELLVFGGESTPHNAAKPTTAHEEQA